MSIADSKEDVGFALENNDLDRIVSMARASRGILKHLIQASYDKDTLAGWRAIKAVGMIARELVAADAEFLRETCRKLLWSLSDESGGIGWSAPELLGEIVASDPKRFADIILLITSVYDIEETTFRPGVLYALARIAEKSPEIVYGYADILLRGLSEPDPLAKIYAMNAFRSIAGSLQGLLLDDVNKALDALMQDRRETWVYEGSGFVPMEVAEYARDILSSFPRS